MSDTPRTDALIENHAERDTFTIRVSLANLSCQLERELAKAKKDTARLAVALKDCAEHLHGVRTGEDFEVACWCSAERADDLLAELKPRKPLTP